jgi:hypothetical protein
VGGMRKIKVYFICTYKNIMKPTKQCLKEGGEEKRRMEI